MCTILTFFGLIGAGHTRRRAQQKYRRESEEWRPAGPRSDDDVEMNDDGGPPTLHHRVEQRSRSHREIPIILYRRLRRISTRFVDSYLRTVT